MLGWEQRNTENRFHSLLKLLPQYPHGLMYTTCFPTAHTGGTEAISSDMAYGGGAEDYGNNIAHTGRMSDLCRGFEPGSRLTEACTEELLLSGKPCLIEKENQIIFAEPFYQQERLILFGGGHLAEPLVIFGKLTGFYVVVADDREEFASRERFPKADEIHCGSFSECIRRIVPKTGDYCVIITRGHSKDIECIRELFRYEESVYTGMIGSKKRTGEVRKKLAEEGLSQERLSRIATPIGLSIGAKTVGEIGISIMAQVIERKRLTSQGAAYIDRSDCDFQVLNRLAQTGKPCALATVMATEGSVPRGSGARMVIYPDGTIFGSIGGGGVESAVIRRGVQMIGSGSYEIMHVDLNGKDAIAEGMICGGKLIILLEDFLVMDDAEQKSRSGEETL